MKSIVIASLALALVGFAALRAPTRAAHAYPGTDNLAVVEQSCDGFGKVTARFAWQSYNQGDQWLDVSSVNADFVWNTFFGYGPFTTNQQGADRGGLLPNTVYFARVNTAIFPFWIPSNTTVFQTRGCTATGTPSGSPPQTCDGFGNVTARFAWQSFGDGDHWLDVSTTGGGFAWGTFFGLGPFLPHQTTADRGGLRPSTLYYARINAAIFPFWVASPTFSFETISCTATPTPTSTPAPTSTPVITSTPTPSPTP